MQFRIPYPGFSAISMRNRMIYPPVMVAKEIVMTGYVTSTPRTLLRFEGLAVLAAACFAYARFGQGWEAFALFFLTPDLAMLGYLGGKKLGAAAYNLAHWYAGPLILLSIGIVLAQPVAISAGLIWGAHIGLDRALGYGLKYEDGFFVTHLGLLGKAGRAAMAA